MGKIQKDIQGNAIINTVGDVSDTANVWEENIRNAMEDRRLMIPLEVRLGDEVEVPPNPYPFVMLPVLDYAEGEGIFPEDVIRSENMIFF